MIFRSIFFTVVTICFFFFQPHSASAQKEERIADSVSQFLTEANLERFLGFGMAIVQKGKDDLVFSHGYANNDFETKFTDSTIFNLGSVSKLFTALAMVKMAEEDALDLNDPVYVYFPEFLKIQGKSRYAGQITLMDLLMHRSGITQSMENLFPEIFDEEAIKSEESFYENTYNYRAFLSMEDFRSRFLMYARIQKTPWKKYNFSNLGYVLLGYILEEITGMSLGQYVTNKILVPLGMNDSHFYQTPPEKEDQLAWGYYKLADGSYLNVHQNEVESPSPTGDGGIKTSLRDMAKFMKFLTGGFGLEEENQKVLSRKSLVSMVRPYRKGPDKDTWVGIGFHNLQPFNFAGHAGGWDGFLDILYYHPESNSCIFLVTNREDNDLYLFLKIYAAFAVMMGTL